MLCSDSIFDEDKKITLKEALKYIKQVTSTRAYPNEEVCMIYYSDYSKLTKIRLSTN